MGLGTQNILRLALLVSGAMARAADLTPVITALRAQDYQRALTLAHEMRSQTPSDPRVWTLEGMANEGLKNRPEALKDYRAAVRLHRDYVPALKAEAQLEYADGNPESKTILEHLVRLDSTDQVSHAMLAALAYKEKNCGAAVAEYRQSSTVISTNAEALTQFGECLLQEGQPEPAIAALSQVATLKPADWQSRYNLASAEMADKQPAKAMETLQADLSSADVAPEVLNLAARAYEASGDTPRAVESLRQAILRQPKKEAYYLNFADLCFDHTSFQVGVDMIDAGLTQLPRSANLYLARGILFGQLGDFAKAESDFDHADSLDRSGTVSGAAASLAELQNSNLSKALAIARGRLKTNPRDPMLHYVKAATLKQMGAQPGSSDFQEAVTSAQIAVRLKPDFSAARNLLGSLYLQQGKYRLAEEQFRAVLKADPIDQTALYHLIQVSRKSGETREVPGLVKQLSEARMAQRRRDEATAKYRLVEVKKGT